MIAMLTGDEIHTGDLSLQEDGTYLVVGFGTRKRYRVSPGPEGLQIETENIGR